jgi:hypothetical protein
MSKPKHTPGPWWVEVHPTQTSVEAKHQTVALDVSNDDAKLIAAAPDLKDALEHMLDAFGLWEDYALGARQALNMARAAIAKAEGGTDG